MTRILTYASQNAVYVVLIGILAPIATIASYVYGLNAVFKGQSTSIVASFVVLGLALLLWILYKSSYTPSRVFRYFLIFNIVAWAVIALLVWRDGDSFAYTTFIAPVIYLIILAKPSTYKWSLTAGDYFAFALVAIAIVSHILHVTGIHQYSSDGAASRLPEFMTLLGFDQRWGGPFVSTSDAGPVGAFIFFYSLLRTGWIRRTLAGTGIVILIISTSWTSIYASIVGIVVLLWFVPKLFGRTLTQSFRVSATTVIAVGTVIYVLVLDPTFNGRVGIWADYLEIWAKNPLVGIGTSGLVDMHGDALITHQHAHNYYVDILTRHGLFGFVVTIPVLIVAGVIAYRAGRNGLVAAPALFVVFCVALVGETLVDWRSLGYVLMELLLMTLISASFLHDQQIAHEGELQNA